MHQGDSLGGSYCPSAGHPCWFGGDPMSVVGEGVGVDEVTLCTSIWGHPSALKLAAPGYLGSPPPPATPSPPPPSEKLTECRKMAVPNPPKKLVWNTPVFRLL